MALFIGRWLGRFQLDVQPPIGEPLARDLDLGTGDRPTIGFRAAEGWIPRMREQHEDEKHLRLIRVVAPQFVAGLETDGTVRRADPALHGRLAR